MKGSSIFLTPAPYGKEGVFILDVSSPQNYFYLIGSSVLTGTNPDAKKRLTSLMVVPNELGDGVLAINVWIGQNKVNENRQMFIRVVGRDEGKPQIDLENVFIPKAGRIGHVSGKGVEVYIKGEYFTSDKSDAKEKGKRYVADHDLLCKYLVCHASEEDVISAAEKAVEEVNAIAEAAELRKENEMLTKASENLQRRLKDAHADLSTAEAERVSVSEALAKAKEIINGLWEEKALLEKTKEKLSGIANYLVDAGDWKPWGAWKRRQIRTEIAQAYSYGGEDKKQ